MRKAVEPVQARRFLRRLLRLIQNTIPTPGGWPAPTKASESSASDLSSFERLEAPCTREEFLQGGVQSRLMHVQAKVVANLSLDVTASVIQCRISVSVRP